jgi:hypothetical protein
LPGCTAVDTRLLFTTSSPTKHRKQTAPMPSRDYLSASLTPSLSLSLLSSFLHGCRLLWTKQNQRTYTVHTLQQTECCSTVTQLYLTPVASHAPLARQFSKLRCAINSLFVTHVYESKETPAPFLTFWHRSFTSSSSSSCSGRIRFHSCSLYPQNKISSSVVLCVFVLLVYTVVLV